MTSPDAGAFEDHRNKLHAIAYAVLGSASEADDVLQEAWIRWQQQPSGTIRDHEAWLVTAVTRIAIDELKSARRRRETYVGTWLPEPLVSPASDDPAAAAATADAVEMALLVLLERLTPAERAAFVLCDVFGTPAPQAATALGRSPEAVRQLASRARRYVHAARPAQSVDHVQHRAAVHAFVGACRGRDIAALMRVLAPDVHFESDGGGKVTATRKPLGGRARVAKALAGFARLAAKKGHRVEMEAVDVNGRLGVLMRAGSELSLYALESHRGRITHLRVVRNPDKLASVYRDQDTLLHHRE